LVSSAIFWSSFTGTEQAAIKPEKTTTKYTWINRLESVITGINKTSVTINLD
jgi:hypothetical protein